MTSPQTPPRATVTLCLDLGTETITGTLEAGDGAERPFWGWLELSDTLDEARGAKRADQSSPGDTSVIWMRVLSQSGPGNPERTV
jgi:hypothetical protein